VHLRLITVGTRMPAWVTAGYEDYARRLPRELKIDLVEIPLAARGGNADIPRLKATEGERILRAVGGARLFALDETGTGLSTLQWAESLTDWMRDGRDVALAVGGPDGHAEPVLQQAEARWSLSKLTLPHALVRVVLAEQLYRAWSVTVNHPYHRA